MKGTLEPVNADERALAHSLCMAMLRYRGGAESDDGQAEGFMVALTNKFDSATREIGKASHPRLGT